MDNKLKNIDLSSYLTRSDAANIYASKSGDNSDLKNYYTKTEIDNKIQNNSSSIKYVHDTLSFAHPASNFYEITFSSTFFVLDVVISNSKRSGIASFLCSGTSGTHVATPEQGYNSGSVHTNIGDYGSTVYVEVNGFSIGSLSTNCIPA